MLLKASLFNFRWARVGYNPRFFAFCVSLGIFPHFLSLSPNRKWEEILPVMESWCHQYQCPYWKISLLFLLCQPKIWIPLLLSLSITVNGTNGQLRHWNLVFIAACVQEGHKNSGTFIVMLLTEGWDAGKGLSPLPQHDCFFAGVLGGWMCFLQCYRCLNFC